MTIDARELARSPLLAGLDARALRGLADDMREHRYEPGDTILEAGAGGVGFFVLVEGAADVLLDGRPVAVVGPGEWFGEVALLDETVRRTASIVATAPTRCGAMPAWLFKPFVLQHPEVAWSLMQSLARQLGRATSPAPA